MSRNSVRIVIAIAILALAVLSCGTPATPTAAPQQPVATQPSAPTQPPAPTEPPADEVPVVPSGLANAVLTINDLPAGFSASATPKSKLLAPRNSPPIRAGCFLFSYTKPIHSLISLYN